MTMLIDGKEVRSGSIFPWLDLLEFPAGEGNWNLRVTCDSPYVRPVITEAATPLTPECDCPSCRLGDDE